MWRLVLAEKRGEVWAVVSKFCFTPGLCAVRPSLLGVRRADRDVEAVQELPRAEVRTSAGLRSVPGMRLGSSVSAVQSQGWRSSEGARVSVCVQVHCDGRAMPGLFVVDPSFFFVQIGGVGNWDAQSMPKLRGDLEKLQNARGMRGMVLLWVLSQVPPTANVLHHDT